MGVLACADGVSSWFGDADRVAPYTVLPPMRAHAPEARAAGRQQSSAAGDARRQADALQSGEDRGEIMSLVGLDQPRRAQPSNDAALHFDGKPQQRTRRRGIAPPSLSGSGDSSSVH
jgi:hypothetical protein